MDVGGVLVSLSWSGSFLSNCCNMGVVCQWVGEGDVGGGVGVSWGVDQGDQGFACSGNGDVDGEAKRGCGEDRAEHNGQDGVRGSKLKAVCSCWRGAICNFVAFPREQAVDCR